MNLARRGQLKRSGIIVVAESEQNGMNTKRDDTERRRRNRTEIITGTEPGNQQQRRVIGMRLKLRFGCTKVACILKPADPFILRFP